MATTWQAQNYAKAQKEYSRLNKRSRKLQRKVDQLRLQSDGMYSLVEKYRREMEAETND